MCTENGISEGWNGGILALLEFTGLPPGAGADDSLQNSVDLMLGT